MAFDHENHTIDPVTGFQIHKETGHRIGVDPAPPGPVHNDADWPKWVKPHDGHVHRQRHGDGPEHVSAPHFPHHHVNRASGEVTVLVHTPDEEAVALADPHAPKEHEAPKAE